MSTETQTQSEQHVCRYCNRAFKKPSTLSVHLCEPKRRQQQKNEKGVQIGLQAYLRFYEMTQGSARFKTYDDFASSPYYNAFVKFGQNCVMINAVNVRSFIEWLIRNNKKLDHWHKDSVYEEYLHHYLRIEPCTDALQRAIEYSIQWSEKTGNPAQDVLRYGNANTVAYAVSTGRIGAWAIYNCESGQSYLENLNADQTQIVWQWIDPDYWQKKFQDYPADQAYAESILKQAGW